MKITFKDKKFKDFAKSTFEYMGEKYKIAPVSFTTYAFGYEEHLIAEEALAEAVREHGATEIDEMFSYYATADEKIYDIVEAITGEKIKKVSNKKGKNK